MPTIPGPSIKLMVMNWLFQTPIPQIRTVGAALLLGLALAPLGCATTDGPILPKKYAISAANPHASRAGLAMLRAGGSAVDPVGSHRGLIQNSSFVSTVNPFFSPVCAYSGHSISMNLSV